MTIGICWETQLSHREIAFELGVGSKWEASVIPFVYLLMLEKGMTLLCQPDSSENTKIIALEHN